MPQRERGRERAAPCRGSKAGGMRREGEGGEGEGGMFRNAAEAVVVVVP